MLPSGGRPIRSIGRGRGGSARRVECWLVAWVRGRVATPIVAAAALSSGSHSGARPRSAVVRSSSVQHRIDLWPPRCGSVTKPVRGFPSDGPKIVNAVNFLLLVDVALIHLGSLPLTPSSHLSALPTRRWLLRCCSSVRQDERSQRRVGSQRTWAIAIHCPIHHRQPIRSAFPNQRRWRRLSR